MPGHAAADNGDVSELRWRLVHDLPSEITISRSDSSSSGLYDNRFVAKAMKAIR